MPEMKMDDFLFSPSGYSMNGIMKEDMVKKLDSSENLESPGKGRDPSFVTIHVTPQVQIDSSQSHLSLFQKSIQPSCSYASFETNSLSASIQLIRQVLEIFNPEKFILNFYSIEDSLSSPLHEELRKCSQLQQWRRKELQICNNEEGWQLTYANFAAAVI